MNRRSFDYLERRKASRKMLHPEDMDLKDFLIAEFDASNNIIVKKDILKVLDELEHPVRVRASDTVQ